MTSSLRGGSPLGLAQAQHSADARKEGPLRIVAHNGAAIFGGAERALVRLLYGLQKRGHEVSLACNHEIVAQETTRRMVPAIVLPLRGDLMFGDVLRLAAFLKRELPDVLLLGTFKKIWLGGMAAARAGVPRTVARVGLASDTPRRFKYRVALRRWIDRVVLNAAAMRADFEAGMPGYPADRILTIHNGITRAPVQQPAGALRQALGIPAEAPVIGTVARLARQKRLDRLADALGHLPGVYCIIAGDGPERSALESRLDRAGLGDRTRLLGAREDVGDVLASLDIFVVSSDQEGMSNAMLEAMAAGVPVVSTDVSGAREAFAPLDDGVQPGVIAGSTPTELAEAVAGLLAHPERRRLMAQSATLIAQRRFGEERMLDAWEQVLRGGSA